MLPHTPAQTQTHSNYMGFFWSPSMQPKGEKMEAIE